MVGVNSSNYTVDGTINIASSGALLYRGGAWGDVVTRLELSDRASTLPITTETNRAIMNNIGVRGCVIIP
ncbi:MAG: hypothetical protein IPP48_00435 [Chitinophagaceae bacterium]|nr:hypothetical protein [Chitinophagaceae bacterium]